VLSVGSLFSGAGLLDYGLTLAGMEHAWLCEADPWRREILALRWPRVPIFEDVRAVDGSAPRVDFLVGGFPCRGASTAGDRTGLDHPETALWWEMARVIRLLRPRLILIENVANLLTVPSQSPGRAWGEVLGELAEIGYVCAWDCLPAAAFGAPHLRDRVFAVAALSDQEGWLGKRPSEGSRELGKRGRPHAHGCASPDAEARPEGCDSADPTRGLEAELGGGVAADSTRPDRQGTHGERAALGGVAGDRGTAADPGRPGRQERDGAEPRQPQNAAADSRAAADADLKRLKGERLCLQRGRPRQDSSEAARGGEVDWGAYAGGIARWEEVAGPAPEPLLRGLDARSARRVVRSQLSALGDGVQVQAGEFLGRRILDLFACIPSSKEGGIER
jgi:DNA (cytosine-5)-methyltransferase 1